MSKKHRKTEQKHRVTKKPGILYFTIEDPIFHRVFYILIGDRELCWNKLNKIFKPTNTDLERLLPIGVEGIATSFVNSIDGAEANVMWFHKLDHEFIAHECLHTTYDVMSKFRIPLCEQTNEVYAYYHGFLVSGIYQYLNKQEEKLEGFK